MELTSAWAPMVSIGAIVVCAMLVIIIGLLANRQLSEKYAVLWLLIGAIGLVIILVPGLLTWLTGVLHVQLPSNLLFAGAIVLLVGVALHLSWELSRAETEIRRLAEDSAINSLETEKLIRRVAALEQRSVQNKSGDDRHNSDSSAPTQLPNSEHP